MPIEFTFHNESRLMRHRAWGVLQASEISDAVRKAAKDRRFRSGLRQLFDLSDVEYVAATYEELLTLSIDGQRYQEQLRGGRLAIVAPRDVQYGLARMYQTLCIDLPLEVAAFRDATDARQWLGLTSKG